MLIITHKTTKTFRGERDELGGADAAATNGAASYGEKVSEGASVWVVEIRTNTNNPKYFY